MGKYNDAEKEAFNQPSQSRHEMLIEQLRKKFMLLPKEQKDLIREAKAAGFEWKGEDTHRKLPQLENLTHFGHVFREWKLMKELGLDEYKKTARAKRALARLYGNKAGSLGKANQAGAPIHD